MIKKPPVTVKHIAKKAGLSPSTVSAVLNNRQVERRISEESSEKVLHAARELGYVPNIAARRLRDFDGASRQIVVVILTSYEAPVRPVSRALRAMEEVIAERDGHKATVSVGVEFFHGGRLDKLPGLVEGRRCNGAIVTNTTAEDDDFLARITLPFPVVLLGRSIQGYPGVSEPPGAVGRGAAELFESIDRRNPAILCPDRLTQTTRDRLTAYSETVLRDTGRLPEKIVCSGPSAVAGYEAVKAYLETGGGCDGIFAVAEGVANGAYRAIKGVGRSIPEDIAVIGVEDHETGAFLDPPLTSFSNAQDVMNRQVAESLLCLLQGGEVPPANTEVPVFRHLRESTGHRSDAGAG